MTCEAPCCDWQPSLDSLKDVFLGVVNCVLTKTASTGPDRTLEIVEKEVLPELRTLPLVNRQLPFVPSPPPTRGVAGAFLPRPVLFGQHPGLD